jgi:hypothetical protein
VQGMYGSIRLSHKFLDLCQTRCNKVGPKEIESETQFVAFALVIHHLYIKTSYNMIKR